MVLESSEMDDYYDVSKWERGKYYGKNIFFQIPVCLDSETLEYFFSAAEKRGVQPEELLYEILGNEIERMKAADAA